MAKRAPAMGWKGILISVGINLIFAFVAARLFVGHIESLEIQKAIDGEIIVEAEIVQAYQGGSKRAPEVRYRYVSDDGILYEGYTGKFGTYNESLKHLGEKIEIYIGDIGFDGKGVCWIVGSKFNLYTSLIFASIFCFFIFGYIVLLIIYLLWYYDKLPKRKNNTSD